MIVFKNFKIQIRVMILILMKVAKALPQAITEQGRLHKLIMIRLSQTKKKLCMNNLNRI